MNNIKSFLKEHKKQILMVSAVVGLAVVGVVIVAAVTKAEELESVEVSSESSEELPFELES